MTKTRRGPRATTFSLSDDSLMRINVLASARGSSNRDVVDAAITYYLSSPGVQAEIKEVLASLVD